MGELIVESFAGGLNTDKDPARLPLNEATVAQDIDIRDDLARKLPGEDAKFDSLPSTIIFKSAIEVLFTQPSEKQVTLCHGTVSGVDKLYIRPHLDLAGAWVDSWLEITEREGTNSSPLTADGAATSTTVIESAGLAQSADDYYNQFLVYNVDRAQVSLVKDFGSTDRLTLKWAISGQVQNDTFWIVRFPIWRWGNDTGLFQPDDYARFRARENAIEILTGNQTGYPSASDLILMYVNRSMLDDSDLNFNSLLCEPNELDWFNGGSTFYALSAQAETTDPLEVDDWIVVVVGVFDGFQEGGFNPGHTNKVQQTAYNTDHQQVIASNEKIRISFDFFPAEDSAQNYFRTTSGQIFGSTSDRFYWSRRLTHFDIYMAKADLVITSLYSPTSEFRRVRRVEIDNTDWSGTGPYTQAVDILGGDWTNAEGETPEFRRGHRNFAIHAQAEFVAFVGRHLFLASVFIDKQRTDIILRTPINSDDLNTPDVKAQNLFLKTSTYGIPRIMGIVESLGRLIVLGETALLRIIPTFIGEPQVEEVPIKKGPIAKKGIIEANGIIYYAGSEGLFAFNVRDVQKESDLVNITDRGGRGGIRQEWQAFTETQKQDTVAGYDRNRNCVLFNPGGTNTNYLFWIDRGAWTTFTGITQPTWCFTGIDGEMIALTG